jgi:DnaJ-class molecular chaperone
MPPVYPNPPHPSKIRPVTNQCPECHGNGLAHGIGPQPCTTCVGTGKVPPPERP